MNNHPQQTAIFQRARAVEVLVLDVDGVLTDGTLVFSDRGEELKAFSTLDGHGLKMLRACGIESALVTGRHSRIVTQRAAGLGIELVYQDQPDKLHALDTILDKLSLDYGRAAYVGDDLPDLPCIRRVALGITVPNAHPEVKEHAFCVTSYPGGAGAVREVCDWILRARSRYEQALAAYL